MFLPPPSPIDRPCMLSPRSLARVEPKLQRAKHSLDLQSLRRVSHYSRALAVSERVHQEAMDCLDLRIATSAVSETSGTGGMALLPEDVCRTRPPKRGRPACGGDGRKADFADIVKPSSRRDVETLSADIRMHPAVRRHLRQHETTEYLPGGDGGGASNTVSFHQPEPFLPPFAAPQPWDDAIAQNAPRRDAYDASFWMNAINSPHRHHHVYGQHQQQQQLHPAGFGPKNGVDGWPAAEPGPAAYGPHAFDGGVALSTFAHTWTAPSPPPPLTPWGAHHAAPLALLDLVAAEPADPPLHYGGGTNKAVTTAPTSSASASLSGHNHLHHLLRRDGSAAHLASFRPASSHHDHHRNKW
jgi:hypothetical protein